MTPTPCRLLPRLLCVLLGLAGAGASYAETPVGPDVQARIADLGRLNGVALACDQMALSQRLRNIVIYQAPKERQVGEWFEQATSESYLAQGKSSSSCPESRTLAGQIDAAGAALQQSLR